ncbi:MAG: hypothetical protein WA667_14030 [Candidatus Nitrosopolaris sp.]
MNKSALNLAETFQEYERLFLDRTVQHYRSIKEENKGETIVQLRKKTFGRK